MLCHSVDRRQKYIVVKINYNNLSCKSFFLPIQININVYLQITHSLFDIHFKNTFESLVIV
jgi:hypothetical protein